MLSQLSAAGFRHGLQPRKRDDGRLLPFILRVFALFPSLSLRLESLRANPSPDRLDGRISQRFPG
jgi:hypothetical protein